MATDQLHDRITDQFSYRGERADVWRAFDLLLDTDAFLNLGYSAWYQSPLLGSSQRRLATEVGSTLARQLPATDGAGLLDVGCGRGGPTLHLAERFGYRVTGIDLVPYNVTRAWENARERRHAAEFAVGDATRLPFAPGSFAACTAIDSLVYLPERATVFAAIADALEPEGVVVLSDLVVRGDVCDAEARLVSAFAEAWDMPALGSLEEYERALEDVDVQVVERRDITRHSVGRFRKWTTLFCWLLESPVGVLVERALRSAGLDPVVLLPQIRRAHEALPSLRHVIVVGKKTGEAGT